VHISFYGAAGEVTGSCYLVETVRARVLVDFGLHQGDRTAAEKNRRLPPIDAPRLDAVVVTHAHIDHTGRLPLLAGAGFRGRIHVTPATKDLCGILLRDSAHIQDMDAARDTVRSRRKGGPDVPPLYTIADVESILARLDATPYESRVEVAPGVTVRFVDSGHMLGSASVVLTAEEPGSPPRTVVFSGDVGPRGVPLLQDPVIPRAPSGLTTDMVILESTYGDRDHQSLADTVEQAAGIVREAVWDKQKVLVPAFAVGRSQLVVHYLGELARDGRVPKFPVYLDSPMAIAALGLYRRFATDLDEASRLRGGQFALDIPGLHPVQTGDESRQLNNREGAAVIIAGSGMCNGGRIVHHLKHNLWKKNVQVLIAGYQAVGTLGRQLVDGADMVRIHGDEIAVRAKVHTLGGFSAHAGRHELINWGEAAARASATLPRMVLTHGEAGPRAALRDALTQRLGVAADCPAWGDRIPIGSAPS